MKHATTFSMMMSFTHKLRHFFIFSIIAAIFATLLSFLAPLILGFTVDSIIGEEGTQLPVPVMWIFEALSSPGTLVASLLACAILIASTEMLSGFLNYVSRVNMAKGAESMINNMRIALFTHTQNLPFSWHTKNQTGDIIQRCTSDSETIRRFILNQLIEVMRTVILIVIAITIMFILNPIMATVVTAFMPFVICYSFFFFKRIGNKFHLADEAEGALMIKVQENLTGVRVVRAFGRERYELERFDEKNKDLTRKWFALGGTLGAYWGIGDIFAFSQALVVILVGSYLAYTSDFTVGDLLVFLGYAGMLQWPVRILGRIINEMSRAGVSLRRIKEIFDADEETDAADAVEPPMDRDIEFKNVSFTYEKQPVLSDVNFVIKSGTTFGILGATGSGKSTITYLLNGLYDLQKDGGSITIGGVNVADIKKSHLRRNIGLVLQEPFLFSKTILENIDIATRKRDLPAVREKARIAAIDDDIDGFAKGYDTIVGERGVTLSGGQKQRVAIARTLMMNSPIMVFDDSMSNLDIETDAKIRESLREDTKGATVILISHRIATLMNADVIIVLEDGKVAEMGSHSDLVKKDGIYRRIYDLQSGYVTAEGSTTTISDSTDRDLSNTDNSKSVGDSAQKGGSFA